MKRFFKYILVTFSGTFLGLLVFILFVVIIFAGIFSSASSDLPEIKENSVLYIDFNQQISEKTISNPLKNIIPSTTNSDVLGVHDIIRSIYDAADNSKIKGIVLKTEMIYGGYEAMFEIRSALEYFKSKQKFVYAYSDVCTQKAYLLQSVADSIFINPQGIFELTGLSVQIVYFKKLLEKIGLEPVIFKAGKYKSATEPFFRESMSVESKEQLHAYISDVWKSYSELIKKSRTQIKEPINYYTDSLLVWNPESAIEYGFVDASAYYDEFIAKVKQKLDVKDADNINQITLSEYIEVLNTEESNPEQTEKIAVIYAQGEIVTGEGDDESIGADAMARIIRKVRRDSTFKAVVFRINSGGGSALASEIIWREVYLTSKEKPVIVSMGDLAASGGYYIAAPATYIVAESSTLTGSIGVFGMYVKGNKLFENVGLAIDTVKTNNYSDIGSFTRDMLPRELQIIGKSIDHTYNTFKNRVAEGRGISVDFVESIAQGRIWSGTAALNHKLIDTIGTIITAIDIAEKKSKISKNYQLVQFPESKDFIDELFEGFMGSETKVYEELQILTGFDVAQYVSFISRIPKQDGVYMQLPYFMIFE